MQTDLNASIQTSRLELVPLQREHAEELFPVLSSPSLYEYIRRGYGRRCRKLRSQVIELHGLAAFAAQAERGERKVRISVSIDVPSLEEGIRFYAEAFGFVETSRPHESYAVLTSGDARIGLLAKSAGTSPAEGCDDVRRYERHWTPVHIDLNVEDFEPALKRATDAGAKCEQLHRIAGYPPVAFCSDPFGHGFCIIGRRERERD